MTLRSNATGRTQAAAKPDRKPGPPIGGCGSSTRASNQRPSVISKAKAGSSAPSSLKAQGTSNHSIKPKHPWREANAEYDRRVLHKIDNIKQSTEQARSRNAGQERLSDLKGLEEAYTSAKTAYATLSDAKKQCASETEIKKAEATYNQLLVAAEAMSLEVNSKRPGGPSASSATDGLTASRRFRQNHSGFYADVKDKLDALNKRIKQGPDAGPLQRMKAAQEAFIHARKAYQELQQAKGVSNTKLSSQLQVKYTQSVRKATKLYNDLPPHPRKTQAGSSNESQSVKTHVPGGRQMVLRGASETTAASKGKGKALQQ